MGSGLSGDHLLTLGGKDVTDAFSHLQQSQGNLMADGIAGLTTLTLLATASAREFRDLLTRK